MKNPPKKKRCVRNDKYACDEWQVKKLYIIYITVQEKDH